MTIWSF